MTEIKIVFEYDLPMYGNPAEVAERKIHDFIASGDALIDVAWIYYKKDGRWIEVTK